MSAAGLLDALAEPLREWLPRQRWFAGKGQVVDAVEPLAAEWLVDDELAHALVTVRQGRQTDTYQLLVGLTREPAEYQALIDDVGGRTAFEAAADPEQAAVLLEKFDARAKHDQLVFALEPGVELKTGLHARAIGAEQSNTSIVFGDEYILKLYRRPHPGPQRDLELHRALASVGSTHIAEPLGSLHASDRVLGMLQRFFPDAAEGWAAACVSVRDLMAEGDLHADEVGGDFAGESHRLGTAVASVHAELADALGRRQATGEELAGMVASMHARLDRTVALVPDVTRYERAARAAFDELPRAGLNLQQVHGDLHLGQVLRATSGWVLIDFEGEPAATLADRAAGGSPLRDVAGMLRSFDYAAHQHLFIEEHEAEHQHAVRALEWSERNRAAFCAGYAESGEDPREHKALLRAFELDKAIYEVAYEHQNRPGWLPIPLAALSLLSE